MKPKLNIKLILCMLALATAALACGLPVQGLSAAPANNPQNGSQNGTAATQTSPAADAAPTSVSIVADPETTIHNILAATLKSPPFRTTVTITTEGSVSEMTAEVILPDQFHITSKHTDKTSEMYIIKGKAYTNASGKWVESTQDMSGITASFASAVSKDTTISDVKFVRADVVDGVPALVYSFNSLYKPSGIQVNTATMMWVNPLTGLPIKMVEDSDYNGTKSHIEQTIVYDSSISIQAPTTP